MTRIRPTTPRALLSTFVLAAALAMAAIRCGRDVDLGTAPPPDAGTDANAAELDGGPG
jgi:hypothetical protein